MFPYCIWSLFFLHEMFIPHALHKTKPKKNSFINLQMIDLKWAFLLKHARGWITGILLNPSYEIKDSDLTYCCRLVSNKLHRTQLNHEQPLTVNKGPKIHPTHASNTHAMAVKVQYASTRAKTTDWAKKVKCQEDVKKNEKEDEDLTKG